MKTNRLIPILTCAGLLFGCGDETTTPAITEVSPDSGSGTGSGAAVGSNADASPGGIWQGVDPDGGSISMIVTETGRFHLVDGDLSQGSGVLSVNDANEIESSFQFVTQRGSTFADGSTSTICGLAGTLVAHETLTINVDCRNTAAFRETFDATLSGSDLYERASSLDVIAGNYQGNKSVLDIASDGTAFSQDPGTGCVLNGQVSVIDAAFNAYDIEFSYSGCVGDAAILNGSDFIGMTVVDDAASPATLFIAAIGATDGDVPSFEGNFVSYVASLDRL